MVNDKWRMEEDRFYLFTIDRLPFAITGSYTGAHVLPKAGRKGGVQTLLIDSDLFEPYERLVTIEILGRRVEVPENNRLLRCFQFLSMQSISYGDFCWNGDCTNCQFWYRDAGEPEREVKTALSCRFKVREAMVITRLNEHVKLEGINKAQDEAGTRNDEGEDRSTR